MSPPGKRVVITGASSGIGEATATAFAKIGRTSPARRARRGRTGRHGATLPGCRGGEAWVRVVDATDAGAVAAFAAEAADLLGEIDLWFSCVGVGVVGKYQDVPIADHARIVETILVSHMNDAHAVLPILLAQDHGILVNMISVGGYLATPYAAAYSASKFGLRGFSEALRGELSKNPRIHICDVYPTFVDTPGIDHAGNYSGAKLSLPPGALAPETVAKAVVRLARHPRNMTAVGAPAITLKLCELAVPNLGAAMMNGFMDFWSDKADVSKDTTGTLYDPPADASGADGGRRRLDQRRTAGLVAGAAAVLGTAALATWLLRRIDSV